MRISILCTQRPVLAWVLTFVLVILGFVGSSRLKLQQYPSFDQPYITIEINLHGAGPEIVEAQITQKVEDAVSGIEGVKEVDSSSATEDSKVTVEFNAGKSMDGAAADIRDRLHSIKRDLPDEATDPTLNKSKAEDRPVMTIALTSKDLPPSEVANYAYRELQKEIESVSGIARVDVLGAQQYVMHLHLYPNKMASLGIAVADVFQAVKRQNVKQPAGKLITKDREFLVTTVANMTTPEEFENMVVLNKEGHIVRLNDIGYAKMHADDMRTRNFYNGLSGVSLNVYKQTDANPIEVSANVRKLLPTLSEKLPKELKIHMGSDSSIFISQALDRLKSTIFEATILVILVVFLFLGSPKASVIPLITIPISLIGSMFIMYCLGFSLNRMTLLSMVLAIGLVVDDAIIVLENIYRHIEEGIEPLKATIKGIAEISFAVIATTLTLSAVYLPIALSQGKIGKIFTEFAVSLAVSVLLSGFIALTLSPMMCARLLSAHKEGQRKIWIRILFDNTFAKVCAYYETTLTWALANRLRVLAAAFLFSILGGISSIFMPQEFLPKEDQGRIRIDGQSPITSTLQYTEKYIKNIDTLIGTIPEVERRVTNINNPTYDIIVQLKKDRKRSTEEVVKELRKKTEGIVGVSIRAQSESGGDLGGDKTVEFVVMGNKNYSEIQMFAQNLTQRLLRQSEIKTMYAENRGEATDYVITINREKLSSTGVEAATIADMINTLVRGRIASKFEKENKLYDVKVEIDEKFRQNPQQIADLFIKSITSNNKQQNILVPLSELIDIQARSSPNDIKRHNRTRSVHATAFLKPSVSLQDGIETVKRLAKEVLPEDMHIQFTGETEKYLNESQNIYWIFGLALVFIFLIMAAQFESWVDPFIIMLSVPLSAAGAIIALSLLPSGSFNLYSYIGLITLIGLITKHGIMLVDVANSLKDSGMQLRDSIFEAAKLRFRPIIMTTLAMVLGSLPLAWASGAGSESLQQIGVVIVGGMSIGTIFTIYVIPVVYTFLSRKRLQLDI